MSTTTISDETKSHPIHVPTPSETEERRFLEGPQSGLVSSFEP